MVIDVVLKLIKKCPLTANVISTLSFLINCSFCFVIYYPNSDTIANCGTVRLVSCTTTDISGQFLSRIKRNRLKNGQHSVTYGAEGRRENVSV